jgi:tetratricopeptide (TPR) repeat protein
MDAMIWAVLSLPLGLAQPAFQSPFDALRKAEELYQKELYLEAAQIYEALRSSGIEDGVLYYNLGNAYFKAGRLGLAILNYERAGRLLPGDEDVRENLAFARELVSEDAEPPPLPLAVGFAVDLYRRARPGGLARIVSACFLLGGAAVTILLLDRWPRIRTPAISALAGFGVVALVAGASLAAKLDAERNRTEAIVVTENAYVRSGPGEASPRLAEIHEGLKVRVLSEREGFVQVSLANGLTGWLPKVQVETI